MICLAALVSGEHGEDMVWRRRPNLDKAIELYERGDVLEAARVVAQVRAEAEREGDVDYLEDVDTTMQSMRGHLTGETLEEFDACVAGAQPLGRFRISTHSLLVGGVGALLSLVGAFLPYAESSTFARIKDNTLIQEGIGWLFIALAALGAVGLIQAQQRRRRTWMPFIAGVLGVAASIYAGTAKSVLELCPVNSNAANLLNIGCEKASPGLGIYVVGVGCLLMAIAGRLIRRSDPILELRDASALKTCPECAEEVRSAARVCKHCGYRFEAPAAATITDSRRT